MTNSQHQCGAGTDAALRGCVNDVKSMNSLLVECYGFEQSNIMMLVDDPSYNMNTASPTGANIKKQLGALVAASQPGDVLFFHFSGHGTQVWQRLQTTHAPSLYPEC